MLALAQDSNSRKLEQYIVRFPQGMRDYLKQKASENSRSLNAEIISRLQDTINIDSYNLALPSKETDALQINQSAIKTIRQDLNGIIKTLMHYKAQHMWSDAYVENEEDRILMAYLDKFIADDIENAERAYENMEDRDAISAPEPLSRSELIRSIIRKWLVDRGIIQDKPLDIISY